MIEVSWLLDDQIEELAALLVLQEGDSELFWVIERSGILIGDATPDEVDKFVSVWRERALANGLAFSVEENLLPLEEDEDESDSQE